MHEPQSYLTQSTLFQLSRKNIMIFFSTIFFYPFFLFCEQLLFMNELSIISFSMHYAGKFCLYSKRCMYVCVSGGTVYKSYHLKMYKKKVVKGTERKRNHNRLTLKKNPFT